MKVGVPYIVEMTGFTPEFVRQKLKASGKRKKGRAYVFASKRDAELYWQDIHKPYGRTFVYVKEKPADGYVFVRRKVQEGHMSK